MSEETLSALLDGECSSQELDRLLDDMERSPALKQAYSRLCLTREAAEGTRISKDQPCICGDIMSRLDAEPMPFSAKVSDLDARRPRPRFWRSGAAAAATGTASAIAAPWRPIAGLAAAATVAAIAVMVVVPQSRERQGGVGSAGMFGAPQISQPVSLPLPSISRPRNLQMVSAQADELQQAQEDDLSNYLIEHSNTAAGRGMGGTLSYARFTAHNAVYRPQVEEQR